MHTRELSLIRHYASLARSANYLSMYWAKFNPAVAQGWKTRSGQHLAAARSIKAAAVW